MTLRDHLQAIYDQHGQLTPELVVQTARPKNHPLHGRVFDRGQKEAASAWYHHRAEELIRSVKIVYREGTGDEDDRSIRAFYAVRRNGTYEPTEAIVQDDLLRQLQLQNMERAWKDLRREYGHLEEFAALVTGEVAEMAEAA